MNSIISLEHIYKSYGEHKVLTDLSVTIPRGCLTAVTSPSGSGKTTLLRLLMGLETPDSGCIKGLDSLRLSAVFQEDRLCENLTALANIQITTSTSHKKSFIITAMEQVGLFDCCHKPARQLSGGMKRRIAILRALLADYDVLLLDEPFKGLDSATKELVMRDTKSRSLGKTVILVTHDRQELAFMDAAKEIILSP